MKTIHTHFYEKNICVQPLNNFRVLMLFSNLHIIIKKSEITRISNIVIYVFYIFFYRMGEFYHRLCDLEQVTLLPRASGVFICKRRKTQSSGRDVIRR